MNIINYNPLDLIHRETNSRTHSEYQIEQIEKSITQFGFTNPVLIDGNKVIIAGHGRTLAAINLEIEAIPTIHLEGLTEKQIRAYVIADNQLALNAGWDFDMLKNEILGLDDDGFNLDLLGFDENFLENLLVEQEQEKEEEFKDVEESELGNICPRCKYEFD